MQYPRRIQVKTKTRAQRLPPTEQYRWAVSSTFVALSQHRNKPSMWAGWLVGWSVARLLGCLVGSLCMFGVFNYNQSNSTRATCLASPWKCLGSHDHDTFIRNVGGPYHPPFWRCHKPRAGLSNIKRREGGAGGSVT